MAIRSNDELVSRLPKFEVKRSEDFPSWLVVTCPRDECKEIFLVRASTWLKPKHYVTKKQRTLIRGRTCPYCSKVALPNRGSREQ